MEKSYVETTDYVQLHIDWILKNNKYALANAGVYCDYYDIMSSVYKDIPSDRKCSCDKIDFPHSLRNHTAFKLLLSDIRLSKRSVETLQMLEKVAMEDQEGSTNKYFVTIGFNHQTFTPKAALTAVNAVFRKSFVNSAEGVFEFYRTNGEHPHIHIIMEVPKMRCGMLVTKIFQSAGMSKIVLSRNFIDVKECQLYHYDYLEGNKIEEKMECCEKDKLWREQNNLPHKIKK